MATRNTIDEATTQRRPVKIAIDPWLVAILALAFAIRLYGIDSPLSDFSSWRQVDTASIAKNFIDHEFNIFHPQLEYDGPGPNYSQLELQITTFFIAILFKLGGFKDLYARIVPVFMFLGAVIYLYLLVKRYSGRLMASLTALVFSILPMAIYYSRAVQPESAMLLFGVASLYYVSMWAERQDNRSYMLAVAFGILSVLAKLPNIFLFLPVLAIAREHLGVSPIQTIKNQRVLLYFGVIVGVTGVYFGYLQWLVSNFGSPYDYRNYLEPTLHTGNFVGNITRRHIVPQLLSAFYTPQAAEYFSKFLPGFALTPVGLILFVLGFVPIGPFAKGMEKIRPFYAWLAAILIYMLTLVAIIRIDYYLIPLMPIAAFFIARVLAVLARHRAGWIVAAVLVLTLGWQSYLAVSPLYRQDKTMYRYGVELREALRPGEPVILGSFNPVILYYSGHRGWRVGEISLEGFEFLKSEGARYFIPLSAKQHWLLTKHLNENYTRRITKSGCVYYDLKNPNN